MSSRENQTEEKTKGFRLFWFLDINTPCVRECVLTGFAGAVLAGIGYFVATSRVRRSYDVTMGSFVAVGLGTWFYCRYERAKLLSQQTQFQEAGRSKMLYEGTIYDPAMKSPKETPPKDGR
uniref:cytochrome c oxidase assembly protein COX20, mitochondrial-like n=1 Tax=Myxine glutinosa TaxID=7769 RepID=UPI00358E6165